MSEKNNLKQKSKSDAKGTGRVITKEKRVPAKVVVGTDPDIDFVPPPPHLKGAVTVVISNGVITRTMVIHHPIGHTSLDGMDWVITPAPEVGTLVQRKVDPNAQRLAQLRAMYREQLGSLEKPPLLVLKEGVFHYPDGDVVRADAVRAARQAAAAAEATELSHWEGSGAKGDKPRKADYLLFFETEAIAKAEKKFTDFCMQEKVKVAVEGKYPDDYETMGGVNADIPQRSATLEGRVPTAEQMFDGLVYQVANMKLLGLADAKSQAAGAPLPEIPGGGAPKIPPRPKGVTKSNTSTRQ